MPSKREMGQLPTILSKDKYNLPNHHEMSVRSDGESSHHQCEWFPNCFYGVDHLGIDSRSHQWNGIKSPYIVQNKSMESTLANQKSDFPTITKQHVCHSAKKGNEKHHGSMHLLPGASVECYLHRPANNDRKNQTGTNDHDPTHAVDHTWP